jgi:exodeoxyribonuclease VII small subunit
MVSEGQKNSNDIPESIAKLNFEEALSALEDIVQKLESGSVSLEDSIDIYTRGTQLKAHCDLKLKDATARIEKITESKDGSISVSAFDAN